MDTRVYWPPEWDPQQAVLLTWPHSHSDWAPYLAEAEAVFLAVAEAVGRRQELIIACYDEAHRAHVAARLEETAVAPEKYRLYCVPGNDTWARDHGPITVYRGNRRELLNFRFNGWGGKYPAELDDRITPALHAAGAFGDAPLRDIDMVLEGGALESDGEGTLLAARRCIFSSRRNPDLSDAEVEDKLREYLGVRKFLWLDHGALEGDDTDSHIDTLARFCDSRTIAYVHCDDTSDPHYLELKAMREQLAAMRTPHGEPYRLVPLPWPQARYDEDGRRLPATYANFLIIDGAVLVPTYRDPADAETLRVLGECFPQREIIGIDCLPLIRQNGSLHCVTMQIGL